MPFELPIRVYWEDTDAGGIVYHANYLKFCERARSEWLNALGYSQSTLRAQLGGIFVVSDARIQFLQAARLDDELMATAAIQTAGRAAVTFAQHIWRKGPGAAQAAAPAATPPAPAGYHALLCSAQVRVGWVSDATLKPGRIPTELIEKLQA